MFDFTGEDKPEPLARKRAYLADAQRRWPFLTHFDASTTKNERQLVTMVKERCSMVHAKAEKEVREWMAGKVF